MQIKRVVAKNGRVYYYADGKRLPEKKGARLFIKQNKDQIREGDYSLDSLTTKERRSYQAQNRADKRWRYKGRMIPNPFGILTASFGGKVKKGSRELSDLISFEQLQQFYAVALTGSEKTFYSRGDDGSLDYYRSDITGHIADVITMLRGKTYEGYRLTVITEEGEELHDNAGLEAMRQFESEHINDLTDRDAGISFDYYVRINVSTMQILVYLNRTKVVVISP